MEFALNYSPEAAALLRAGRIELDRFKCPDWPDMIAEAAALRPVYVHFPLNAGDGDAPDWAHVAALLESTGTPHVNFHLAPQAARNPEIDPSSAAPADVARVAERMAAEVAVACARFGPERVVVENIPYRPGGRFLRACAEPAAIRQVVEATGCRLLLDLSHARITAAGLGLDARRYVEELPVARLAELHITGIGAHGDRAMEDHLPMAPADWPEVEWALGRVRAGVWPAPRIVALEYGGIGPLFGWRSEAAVIAADVPRLRGLLGGDGVMG